MDRATLSKQQQKSRETKDRIFRAAKEILQERGYEELSIKNICERAGVSNGSFYHHFKTKDDLLSYYIEGQPAIDTELLAVPESIQDVKETVIQVYLNYARYCRELGVDFMSGYYTPKNQALNPTIRTERPYPIVTVENYLKKAISSGVLDGGLDLPAVTTDIRMLVIGNVFEWCLHKGDTDIDGNIRRSFGHYLDSIFREAGAKDAKSPGKVGSADAENPGESGSADAESPGESGSADAENPGECSSGKKYRAIKTAAWNG